MFLSKNEAQADCWDRKHIYETISYSKEWNQLNLTYFCNNHKTTLTHEVLLFINVVWYYFFDYVQSMGVSDHQCFLVQIMTLTQLQTLKYNLFFRFLKSICISLTYPNVFSFELDILFTLKMPSESSLIHLFQ